MKKRVISLLLVLAMLVSMSAFTVGAETTDATATYEEIIAAAAEMSFPECLDANNKATCPVCDKEVTWVAYDGTSTGTTYPAGVHAYLTADLTASNDQGVLNTGGGNTVSCIHLNGHALNHASQPAAYVDAGTLNIMGGEIKGARNKAGNAAVVEVTGSAVFNNYGCLITKAAATSAPSVLVNGASAVANLYGGSVNLDQAEGTQSVHAVAGKVNIYDAKIHGFVKQDATGLLKLSGETVITGKGLTLTAGQTIDASELSGDASIVMDGNGTFVSEGGAALLKYFTAVDAADTIVNDNGALKYIPGILTTSTTSVTAYCPVCDSEETWYPVTADSSYAIGNQAVNGTHFFLSANRPKYTHVGTDYSTDSNNQEICLHLNGKTLGGQLSASAPTAGPVEVLTVMGSGNVTGTSASAWTVRVRNNMNTLNIYGGTYTSTNAAGNVLYNVGGTLNIYGGTFNGSSNTASTVNSTGTLNIYGGTFNGATVSADGGCIYNGGTLNISGGAVNAGSASRGDAIYTKSTAVISGGTINGEVYNTSTLRLIGKPVITGAGVVTFPFNINNGTSYLEDGASINVTAAPNTRLTYDNGAANAAQYFKAVSGVKVVYQSGSGLWTAEPGLNDNLVFAAGTTNAYCPVCKKDVTWTALTNNNNETLHLQNGDHYYVAEDVVYEGATYFMDGTDGSKDVACIHLNGKKITATQERVLYFENDDGNWVEGTVNFMGNGTVSGNRNINLGGTTFTTYSSGKLNLYGGTYTKPATSTQGQILEVGSSTVNIYEGATIDASACVDSTTCAGVYVSGSTAVLNLEGGTIQGGVNLGGNGGNIRAAYGTINLNSGLVTGGQAKTYGGNIYIEGANNNVTVNLKGATVTGGVAGNGGNIAIDGAKATLNITSGNITDGEANATANVSSYDTWRGGNVLVLRGTMNMSGGKISGGISTQGNGGMNVTAGGATLKLTGGEILSNPNAVRDSRAGTALRAHNSTLTLGGNMKLYNAKAAEELAHAEDRYSAVVRLSETQLIVEEGFSGEMGVSFGGSGHTYERGDYIAMKNSYCTGAYTGKIVVDEFGVGQRPSVVKTNETWADGQYKLALSSVSVVDAEGNETVYGLVSEALAAYTADKYLQIPANMSIELPEGAYNLNTNGFKATIGGAATVNAFDTTASLTEAGTGSAVIAEGATATVANQAYIGDDRYIALASEGAYTFHLLQMKITGLTLNTEKAALYYTAEYQCDPTLAAAVEDYGVSYSLAHMPDARNLTDNKSVHVSMMDTEAFDGTSEARTSYVQNILKAGEDNANRGKMEIYANPFIVIGTEVYVADETTGDTIEAEGFNGTSKSLYDVMAYYDQADIYDALEEARQGYLDAFYTAWYNEGISAWNLQNIKYLGGE